MLKVSIGLISIFMLSSNSFAENCIVSNALKEKVCSTEYFKAKNSKDLSDYLLKGKYQDNKLLNLEIDFNVKEKEINIATSCDLRISRGKALFAKQNGICIKALSVGLEGENGLFSDKKAPIAISAANSIKIRRSLLETKGDISIYSSSFLPFDSEVLISRGSLLKAQKININSKSNLLVNSQSKLKSNSIVLNGGNCEINEKDDRENDNSREHDKACRKFLPKFTYSGTCKSNPLPTSLRITSANDLTKSQSVKFEVLGAPESSVVNWKFNQRFDSFDATTQQDFIYPGKHFAQAVIVGSGGYFRKIGQYVNVSPANLNKGQIAFFQFSGSQNNPKTIKATIDMKNIVLTKFDQNPELYFAEVNIDKAGMKKIIVPHFNYQGKFNLNIFPKISNPGKFINQQIDAYQAIVADQNLGFNLSNVLDELRSQINKLNNLEKQQIAETLQSNFPTNIPTFNTVFSENKNLKTTILNLVLNEAQANGESVSDKSITKAMIDVVFLNAAGVIAFIPSISSGYSMMMNPVSPPPLRLAGATLMAGGIAGVCLWVKSEMDLLELALKPTQNMILNLINDTIVTSEVAAFKVTGQFVGIDSRADLQSESSLIKRTVVSVNNANLLLRSSIDPLLSKASSVALKISSNIKIPSSAPKLSFRQDNTTGTLSSQYIKTVTLISSEFGDASIKNFVRTGTGFSVVFTSPKSQNVTFNVQYENRELGIKISKNFTFKVLADGPKAVIDYSKKDLEVSFDSTDPEEPLATGLTYSWNFGDGQTSNTSSKNISHKYLEAGTYAVSLTVTDSSGASDTTQIVVEVKEEVGNLVICNGGLPYNQMNFTLSSEDFNSSFSLKHIYHFDSNGNGTGLSCECKKISVPTDTPFDVHVTATEIASPNQEGPLIEILPYSGSMTISSTRDETFQWYTVGDVTLPPGSTGQLWRVIEGVYYRTQCSERIFK